MSEEKPSAAQPTPFADIVRNTISPPAHGVANIHVTVSATEITLILGRLRALIDTETNTVRPNMGIEWFQSLSLNPIIAKQIHLSISRAVEVYERQFGKIPEDPNFQLAPITEQAAATKR